MEPSINGNNYRRFNAGVIPPDAPVGEWEATVVREKSKVSLTKSEDPMVTLTIRLDRAEEEENESSQGVTLPLRFIFFDESDGKKATGRKMTKIRLRDLAQQTGISLDVIPENLGGNLEEHKAALAAFVEACEGKQLTVWTTHKKDANTGEVNVEVALSKPGGFAGNYGGRGE